MVRDGTCCACGESDTEDQECHAREEGTHCVHWWDGHNSDEIGGEQ